MVGGCDVVLLRAAKLKHALEDLGLCFLQPLSNHLYIINYTLCLMNDEEFKASPFTEGVQAPEAVTIQSQLRLLDTVSDH